MTERIYGSVEELFKEVAPDLLEFIAIEDDYFWKQVRENTITDEELDGRRSNLEELGMYYPDSAIAKAIQLLKDSRKTSLPIPVTL